VGTIFLLISIVLLYATLKYQRLTFSIEKFETKFFDLVRMHRDNVAEIAIGKDSGKKIFVILLREFRSITEFVSELAKKRKIKLKKDEIFVISYYVLFFGVGPNSSRMLRKALVEFEKSL